jgi:hypothetical protein
MRKLTSVLLLTAVLTTQAMTGPAHAVLNPPTGTVVAPVEPAPHPTNGGFPLWYQDKTGLTLSLCIDQNGNCALPFPAAPDPATGILVGPFGPALAPGNGVVPIVTTAPLSSASFPIEAFYWMADTGAAKTTLSAVGGAGNPGKFRIIFGLSAGFATIPFANVQEGQQTAMLRVDIFKMLSGLVPGGVYTITTPYGVITKTADAAGGFSGGVGGQGFRVLIVGGPLGFNAVLPAAIPASGGVNGTSPIMTVDNFLVCTAGAPAGYIGAPLVGCAASLANDPLATPQSVTVAGPGLPVGGVVISSWAISGKKFGMDVNPPVVNFGNVALTTPVTSSAPTTITVTNVNGASPMAIAAGGITLTGPNAADFVIDPVTDTCSGAAPLVVGVNPSCTFKAAFAPKSLAPLPDVGPRSANVNIAATFTAVGASPPPPGLVPVTGTATLTMAATAGANGTIAPTGAALAFAAGSSQPFTVTPAPMFEVKDITINGTPATFTKPANPTAPVTFNAPPLTASGTTINATFMPSGDLNGDGKLDVTDAVKALKILVGLQQPTPTDLVAMKVTPLDANGLPSGTGTPDLNDVVLILKRVLGIVTW